MSFGSWGKRDYSARNKRASNWRQASLEKLGLKCSHCGFADPRALQLDHKKGNGAEERRKIKDTERYYKHIYENIEEYQVLCANCNWIKRVELKEGKKPYQAQ